MASPRASRPAGRADARPELPQAGAAIELDLAFSADSDLAPELLAAAGPWCAAAEAGCGATAAAEHNWQQLFSGWLEQLQRELPPALQASAYSLGLSLVGDVEIASLNGAWRGQAGATDVLAFAAQDADRDAAMAAPAPPPLQQGGVDLELGDIVISLETAARQASEHGNSLSQELLFLASHGLLHLLGWDHPDDASLGAMLERQRQLIDAPAACRSDPTPSR